MQRKTWINASIALMCLVACAVVAVLQAGCGGEAYTPSCECYTDQDCEGDRYCRDCQCLNPCETPYDCPLNFPNCDPDTHTCEAPCPEYECPPSLPNCGDDGICTGPCESGADCPEESPNCGIDGVCFGPCEDGEDCTNPDFPNCDASTGLCFGPCASNSDCTDPDRPNCDPDTGLCQGRCPDTSCPEGMINCTTYGECLGPCTAHADCIDPALPNCDLDPESPTRGLCLEPCFSNDDCLSSLYPNCDPSPGVCLPPCAGNGDCPEEQPMCDTETGLCFRPACMNDGECAPPESVCEDWECVPGCESHTDCDPEERCDLVDEGHLYHCEPRDCLTDADCTTTPSQVCDTDGMADPGGGGYCVDGCTTFYDCVLDGYDCDADTGRCTPHDYGDIGTDCSDGCRSGFCLTDMGDLCTGFCCIQHDCPPDWGCRVVDDGSGEDRSVDVCVPLDPAQGTRRPGEICLDGTDCRSNICVDGGCSETCCSDEDCAVPALPDTYCTVSFEAGVTGCYPVPTTGNDPLGTPGCSTTGSPGDCRSNMCFTFYMPDTDCTTDGDCPERRPICWDMYGDTITDCVRDFCVEHCCSESDCPDYGSEIFVCSAWTFGSGDYDVCMLFEGTAALTEGEACVSNNDCRSMVCSQADGVCRGRCCTDADCTEPAFPRCGIELNRVFSNERLMKVCLP